MGTAVPERLEGWEIHGFRTMDDLDMNNIMEEAKARWLRPNEIHAILCNYKFFNINVKPVNLPKSGTIVLFDRKMLRNFRKDGHNWKKKKDGKVVKEAHEHLKIGTEGRIHVYYAHGQDNPTFVRRCYWLLDKTLEHIVLVHYRETQQLQGSPVTHVNSNSSSAVSDPSVSWLLSEEINSVDDQVYYTSEKSDLVPGETMTIENHEMRLQEINTLEWDELLGADKSSKLSALGQNGKTSYFEQHGQCEMSGCKNNVNYPSTFILPCENSAFDTEPISGPNYLKFNMSDNNCFHRLADHMNSNLQTEDSKLLIGGLSGSLEMPVGDGLQTQESSGRWMNCIATDSLGSVDNPSPETSISTVQESFTAAAMDHHNTPFQEQIFSITSIYPERAFSNEETKILVIGYFHEEHPGLAKFNLCCVCGDARVPAEIVQPGVFSCLVSPHIPGLVNLYLSFDGHKPISQVLTFEYRAPMMHDQIVYSKDKSKWEELQGQMRLTRLLFSTSTNLDILSSKVSENTLKQAKIFANKTAHLANSWADMTSSIESDKISFPQAKDGLFELTLKNKLREWLLETVIEGHKVRAHDEQGQGVIHLCAILDYTWAVYPFLWSGLSLDYRDKSGWTALHWAASRGREKMVAALLSAGAKPNLVTDPTPDNPGGCTAADLASENGYSGLAAYLAEMGLVDHFKDMTSAGNASGLLQTKTVESADHVNLSEEELFLKDSLAAYRMAADAAARIQAAFRERSLKLQMEAVRYSKAENEAQNIVAAMKIQNAFRNYETRKKMKAAARIQYTFRTWKMRREFLNMRCHATRIQAVFRGFQVRKQYRKVIWSVGVVEKAILRWRLKRKGLRGFQVHPVEVVTDQNQETDVEEDFFRASRKQAEERIERSVIRVQALFRSRRAQEEYRRMKLAHNKAQLQYEGLFNLDMDVV